MAETAITAKEAVGNEILRGAAALNTVAGPEAAELLAEAPLEAPLPVEDADEPVFETVWPNGEVLDVEEKDVLVEVLPEVDEEDLPDALVVVEELEALLDEKAAMEKEPVDPKTSLMFVRFTNSRV